jgi:hypothetical protein
MRFVLAVRTQKTSIFYLKNELIFLNSVKMVDAPGNAVAAFSLLRVEINTSRKLRFGHFVVANRINETTNCSFGDWKLK